MTQRNVYTSGTHLAPALVVPAGGGTAVRLDTVTYQAAGNHQHADAVWIQETETPVSGFMSGTEKYKLSTVTAGAEANVWRISAGANNALTGAVYGWSGTSTQYALLTPSNDTLYFVTGGTVTIAESLRFIIPVTGNGDWRLFDANYSGTIFRVTDVRLIGGTTPTATVTLKIDTTVVTGTATATTDTASVDSSATAANTFTARQNINANIAAVTGSPTSLDITVHITKNLV